MLARLLLLPHKIHSIARSVHLLCNATVNSSWLPHDNSYIICWLSTYKEVCKCDHAPFLIFWVGPGDEARVWIHKTCKPKGEEVLMGIGGRFYNQPIHFWLLFTLCLQVLLKPRYFIYPLV